MLVQTFHILLACLRTRCLLLLDSRKPSLPQFQMVQNYVLKNSGSNPGIYIAISQAIPFMYIKMCMPFVDLNIT